MYLIWGKRGTGIAGKEDMTSCASKNKKGIWEKKGDGAYRGVWKTCFPFSLKLFSLLVNLHVFTCCLSIFQFQICPSHDEPMFLILLERYLNLASLGTKMLKVKMTCVQIHMPRFFELEYKFKEPIWVGVYGELIKPLRKSVEWYLLAFFGVYGQNRTGDVLMGPLLI